MLLLKISMFLLAALSAETHLAYRLALKLDERNEMQLLIDLMHNHGLTVSRTDE
jgi:hypothetical protein